MKEKPKCPNCGTNEYVVLDNTGKVVGTGTGIAVGGGGRLLWHNGWSDGGCCNWLCNHARYRNCHRSCSRWSYGFFNWSSCRRSSW